MSSSDQNIIELLTQIKEFQKETADRQMAHWYLLNAILKCSDKDSLIKIQSALLQLDASLEPLKSNSIAFDLANSLVNASLRDI